MHLTLSFVNALKVELIVQDNGFLWENFILSPVTTDSVHMTILSSYGAVYNEIAEIEFYEAGDFSYMA